MTMPIFAPGFAAATALLAGLAFGFAYFAVLRRTVDLYAAGHGRLVPADSHRRPLRYSDLVSRRCGEDWGTAAAIGVSGIFGSAHVCVTCRAKGSVMASSPLASAILFHLGPVAITRPVVTTWAIIAALTLGSWRCDAPARTASRPAPSDAWS